MSKAVLISIRPEWCEKIASGQKTIEVRKTQPKLDAPFTCYIYQTKHRWVFSMLRSRFGKYALADRLESFFGMVIGEFKCDKIYDCDADSVGLFDKATKKRLPESCLDWKTIYLYTKGRLPIYGWHISNLVIYDKPKELSEFRKPGYRTGYKIVNDNKRGVVSIPFNCENVHLQRPPQSWCYVQERVFI